MCFVLLLLLLKLWRRKLLYPNDCRFFFQILRVFSSSHTKHTIEFRYTHFTTEEKGWDALLQQPFLKERQTVRSATTSPRATWMVRKRNHLINPRGLTTIPAVRDLEGITKVIVDQSCDVCTNMGEFVLEGCSALQSIHFEPSL